MIASECSQQETNELVAQAVVDRIARLHQQAYLKFVKKKGKVVKSSK
jgi:hypothetical protein